METIVIDNLEWQSGDDATRRTWDQAVKYAESLGEGWRLPIIEELIGLIDFSKIDPACKILSCRPRFYWSSTTYPGYASGAWGVHFYSGNVYGSGKGFVYYVWCVREVSS